MIERVELTIRQPGHPDRVLTLDEGASRLGRAEDNELVLADVGVSRRHARVLYTRDAVRVEDLGSGNGTYYNGYRIQNHVIEDGDEILIDPFTLAFSIEGRGDFADDEPTVKWSGKAKGARLDVIVGNGLNQSSWLIPERGLTIGRSEQREVILPDPAASRHHCTVIAHGGGYVVRDMGSANGVFVNAKRVREAPLSEGDRIRIGNTEFRFTTGEKAVGDTSTQSLPKLADLEEGEWTEHELSLPLPEVPQGHTQRAAKKKRSVLPLLLGGGAFMVVTGLGLIAVVGALIYFYPQLTAEQKAPTPPDWALQGVSAPGSPDTAPLFDRGVNALKTGDHRQALQSFYQLLLVSPGNPAGERLAYLAGEFLVLSSIEPTLAEAAERDALRQDLIAKSQRRGRAGREARAALAEQFPEEVAESDIDLAPLRGQAAHASEAGRWTDAARLYTQLLENTTEPKARATIRQALAVARQATAAQVQQSWTQATNAEREQHWSEARQGWNGLLQAHPSHPAARLHLARLDHLAAVALAQGQATTDVDERRALLQRALEMSSGTDQVAQSAREALVALRSE